MELWAPWADSLADGHSIKDIETMGAVVKAMRRQLENGHDAEEE